MTTTTVIVRCANLLRFVYPTFRSIERQSLAPDEIVLVADPSTVRPMQEWLAAFASVTGARTVAVTTAHPGGVWNGVIEAVASDLVVCLDAGDELDAAFLQSCTDALASGGQVLALAGLLELGPGAARRIIPPPPVDLERLVTGIHYSRRPFVLSREAWEEVGRFDESLPTLEDYDLLLRLLGSGRQVASVVEPLVIRGRRYDGAYRKEWERRSEATRSLLAKHPDLLGSVAVLAERRKRRDHLAEEHRNLKERRDSSLEEIEHLRERLSRASTPHELEGPDETEAGLWRRTTPVSRDWGCERGKALDRHYIEQFIDEHARDISGVVLEVDNPGYTRRYGGERVIRSDVLDVVPSNPHVTVITDLRCAANVPSDTYDCIILTQTVHVIDDIEAVVSECERILVPGGVLLCTLPSSSRVVLEYGYNGDFWRFTMAGARRLFATAFPHASLEVEALGNALAISAFAFGLAEHEIPTSDLDAHDPYLPLVITVRAVKPHGDQTPSRRPERGIPSYVPGSSNAGAILLYHRVGSPDSDIHKLAVTPEAFRHQMEVLASDFHPMTLTDLVQAVVNGDVPDRAVAVTFDDGYLDNLEAASPILSACGIPATFFIATHGLPEPEEFWWDVLEGLLLAPSSGLPLQLRLELPEARHEFDTSTESSRSNTHQVIYALMQSLPGRIQDEIAAQLRAWAGRADGGRISPRRMTGDQLRELARRPDHEIGAHSSRHLLLSAHPSEVQRRDVEDGRRELENTLGRPVESFAYPFGAFGDETASLIANLGFRFALTCEPVGVQPGNDPWRLPRIEVTRYLERDFSARLSRAVSA